MNTLPPIPESWRPFVECERDKPYFSRLEAFLNVERRNNDVFPPDADIFNALKYTPYEHVKVVLLGQDPYHDVGQAHGLCFSVLPGVRKPPSLVNIFRELEDDLGYPVPKDGYLMKWAELGVLMLNTVLTVRAHSPQSHKGRGWEHFTDAVISSVSAKEQPVVFILWGSPAQKKKHLIATHHHFVESVHPSPLSAHRGYFGSRPFSTVNTLLRASGLQEIAWQIGDATEIAG